MVYCISGTVDTGDYAGVICKKKLMRRYGSGRRENGFIKKKEPRIMQDSDTGTGT
jgi:hypothetical protein